MPIMDIFEVAADRDGTIDYLNFGDIEKIYNILKENMMYISEDIEAFQDKFFDWMKDARSGGEVFFSSEEGRAFYNLVDREMKRIKNINGKT